MLALDTSTRCGSVALVEDGRLVASARHDVPSEHAERLMGLVDQAFAEAGWAKASVDLIGCGLGPGSFTGVRVALATAKGMALGLGVPLVGVGSLRAMAVAAAQPPEALVVALIDARKDEVFWAAYDGGGGECHPPAHVRRGEVARALAALGRPCVVVGEVAGELGDLGAGVSVLTEGGAHALPDAATIARIAAELLALRGADDLDALEPCYVRPPDIHPPRAP